MRIYGMLSGALLAATGMTASAEAAHANPSTITSLDITRVLPAGSYGGLTYRYVEGGIHGEASAEERVAGLRELAAGRTAVPYHVIFHIVALGAAPEADTVVEAPNRGRTIFPGTIIVPAPVTSPSADPIGSVTAFSSAIGSRSPRSSGKRVLPPACRRVRRSPNGMPVGGIPMLEATLPLGRSSTDRTAASGNRLDQRYV
jgi:hypothetical protein